MNEFDMEEYVGNLVDGEGIKADGKGEDDGDDKQACGDAASD